WNLAVATGAHLAWLPRKAGARGAVWAGINPRLLPGGRKVKNGPDRDELEQLWGVPVPATPGRDGRAILENAGELGVLVLAGSDPVADFGDATLASRGIDAAPFIVALDLMLTASSRK